MEEVLMAHNFTLTHFVTFVAGPQYYTNHHWQLIYLQIMSLNDNEIQKICDHLGHSKAVHLKHYRQLSGVTEKVEMAKLLYTQDLNMPALLNKSLKDIQLEGI